MSVNNGELALLPPGVFAWWIYETAYLSRDIDPKLSMNSPKLNEQNPFYSPEEKNIFELKGYWVSVNDLKIFKSQIPIDISNQFFRKRNNIDEVLLLVHPESIRLYSEVIHKSSDVEVFHAVATSSSRSLLVWKPGDEAHPFIAKLSLDKKIANTNRSLQGGELVASLGANEIISKAINLPIEVLFFPEVLGVIPKHMQTGGMIIRPLLPQMISNPKLSYAPLFSLYGKSGEIKNGLLLDMIIKSNLEPKEFVRKYIINPFVQIWMKLAIEQGIVMEPHAQNVLIEIENGLPTGRFVLRDFGGFNIDMNYRESRDLPMPKKLPAFSGDLNKDYYQDSHIWSIEHSLESYFEGGFLYNVEAAVDDWFGAKNEKINSNWPKFRWTHELMMSEISQELSRRLNENIRLTDYRLIGRAGYSKEFVRLVLKSRSKAGAIKCKNLLVDVMPSLSVVTIPLWDSVK